MNKSNLPNLIITGVCSASTLYTPENAKLRKNDRRRWAVVLKYEGETVYTFHGRQLISDANHVVFLPKGCSYGWHCTKAGHFSIIEFECGDTGPEPFGFPIKNSEHILKLFHDLETTRNQKRPMMEMESIRDLYSILLQLAKTGDAYLPTKKQALIAPAVEYISRNYNKPITNDDLAALTGLSTVYFRKLFTEVMGISPMVFARRLRIEKAREMLRSDYGTLSDIAQSLGYASLYDFSRDFKKHTGVAPSNY